MADDEARGVLFILKESLVANGGLSPGYRGSLEKMSLLIEEDPSLLGHLDEWRFVERQLPYFLRRANDRQWGLSLATRILQQPGSKLPGLFMTRKGGFLLSEALYESMDSPQDVISFCEEAAKKSALFVGVLYDCGFFILLNSHVSKETARFYSSVFAYKTYEEKSRHEGARGDDVMYEVRRRYFDPEIVFKDGPWICFKEPPSLHRAGHPVLKRVFDDLYNTTFFNLMDLGLSDNMHLMNYCSWDHLFLCGSPELRQLVIDGNYLAIRLYRMVLEALGRCERPEVYLSKVEDEDLMIQVAKFLECKDSHVAMECGLILYGYYHLFGWGLDRKQFSEVRIRRVFDLLEFSYSSCTCLRECVHRPPEIQFEGESRREAGCLRDCNAVKLLTLLSNLYSHVDKRYFYKPSIMVLMKAWYDVLSKHKCWDSDFFMTFFTDMVGLIGTNPYNVARVIFPFKKTRRRKPAIVADGDGEKKEDYCPSNGGGIDVSEIEDLDELGLL